MILLKCFLSYYIIFLVLSDICLICSSSHRFILQEEMKSRESFKRVSLSHDTNIHEVLIAIQQLNLDRLKSMLEDMGTPGHHTYQQWLSFDEIGDMTKNDAAFTNVQSWLLAENATISWISPRHDYIRASTSISEWNRLLNTTFYVWHDTHPSASSKTYHRADSYRLPHNIDPHVNAIFNTCQAPPILTYYGVVGKTKRGDASRREVENEKWRPQSCSSTNMCDVDVSFLNTLYGISSNLGKMSIKHYNDSSYHPNVVLLCR